MWVVTFVRVYLISMYNEVCDSHAFKIYIEYKIKVPMTFIYQYM